ncbi:MAG: flagellar hook capping FlgD N-terminal domain-containing protein [Candidatus Gastranaerophilales bacterium]|nr:flagellar hook capping FlgD N-terminal domain-containing protein [Candidatus Gastranaerophilales bacterium]
MVSSVNDTLTQIQNNTATVYASQNADDAGKTSLDQDAFLQLLMTQLQYQDPLNPTGSQEFISQQAQLTSVSELQKLNSNLTTSNEMLYASNQIMQASSLIGKEVTVAGENSDGENVEISGVVTEAKFAEEGASVVIDGVEYNLDTVQSIRENTTTES